MKFKSLLAALLLTATLSFADKYRSFNKDAIDQLIDGSVYLYQTQHPYDLSKERAQDVESKARAAGIKWAKDYDLNPVDTRYYLTNFINYIMNAYECTAVNHDQ
jgi:hypothetical protein